MKLLGIKPWLEQTGLKVAESRFSRPPALPYIIYEEDRTIRGSDDFNGIADRSLRIELYSDTIHPIGEGAVEVLLNEKGFGYAKHREWISSEQFYQTVYQLEWTEKVNRRADG